MYRERKIHILKVNGWLACGDDTNRKSYQQHQEEDNSDETYDGQRKAIDDADNDDEDDLSDDVAPYIDDDDDEKLEEDDSDREEEEDSDDDNEGKGDLPTGEKLPQHPGFAPDDALSSAQSLTSDRRPSQPAHRPNKGSTGAP
ncbi:uncharacterized protein LOC135225104 [Macrobrachium nipponense]|uniref:uncharacterized protein LOC135225104 n=1 Tax=Macrobrachium nipponense TaxID=159736 RepID=UPI0030C7A5EA